MELLIEIPYVTLLYTLSTISDNQHLIILTENYKKLYFALFESHLSYCITVFGNANKQYTGKLFVIQKHCTYKNSFLVITKPIKQI